MKLKNQRKLNLGIYTQQLPPKSLKEIIHFIVMIKDKIVVMLLVVLLVIPFINAQSVQSTESSETGIPDDEQTINGEAAAASEEIPYAVTPITDEQTTTAIDDSNEGSPTFPNSSGDIVIARFSGSIKKDHAALYTGNGKIVEADPHMEKWNNDSERNE